MNYYNYFTEIEDAFIRRRAKHLLLSPLDWALIEGWQERGIPLHIVLRAIESVFDGFEKQPNQHRTIKGLFYCREEVEAQYVEWLAAQTGKQREEQAADFSPDAVRGHIRDAVKTLKANKDPDLKEDLNRAVARLEELSQNMGDDPEYIDKTLYDIEAFIDRAMLSNSNKQHLKQLKKEVTGQLRLYKNAMEKDTYKNTFDLMLLKRLREEHGIPRLGLFYI